MKQYLNTRLYKWLVYFIVLMPNIFVAIVGVESFPYTSAPMFGHYIGEETGLYLLKFEGISNGTVINLEPYYGRPESYFIRYFFSKVYGSREEISPFNGRLSEHPEEFQNRMNTFFSKFTKDIRDQQQLNLQRIYLKAVQVDKDRKPLKEPVILGYYDASTKRYIALNEKIE